MPTKETHFEKTTDSPFFDYSFEIKDLAKTRKKSNAHKISWIIYYRYMVPEENHRKYSTLKG